MGLFIDSPRRPGHIHYSASATLPTLLRLQTGDFPCPRLVSFRCLSEFVVAVAQDGVASVGGIEGVARRPWRGDSSNVNRQATERKGYPAICYELKEKDLSKWTSDGHLGYSCRKVCWLQSPTYVER
jgi:hypothetical protein